MDFVLIFFMLLLKDGGEWPFIQQAYNLLKFQFLYYQLV